MIIAVRTAFLLTLAAAVLVALTGCSTEPGADPADVVATETTTKPEPVSVTDLMGKANCEPDNPVPPAATQATCNVDREYPVVVAVYSSQAEADSQQELIDTSYISERGDGWVVYAWPSAADGVTLFANRIR